MRILQLKLSFLREEYFCRVCQVGKEMIPRRKPLNQLQISKWSLILLKTISLELSVAQTSGAQKKIADTPSNAMENFKLYNRGFFLLLCL